MINKKVIDQKDYVKYLGVLIDKQLTFKDHISTTSKKISRIVDLMYRIKKYKTLTMIYYSLIYPFLSYGVTIWGNADDSHLKAIHIIQMKAVRLISNKCTWGFHSNVREHSLPLFTNLKIFLCIATYLK